jgi:gliding motility-associated lipoprotein GldD
MKKLLIPILAGLIISCADDSTPKPKAFLRLEYPKADYKEVDLSLPFTFEKNKLANNITNIKVDKTMKVYGIDIDYPSLKGTIYLTYIAVNENNLIPLLRDSQNLTQKHVTKADEIAEQVFIDHKRRVFGTFYEVGGNAASQSQFYVTDSINHFLNGSLYFYTKPNYDSIYPAAEYLKKDIKHIMESLEWKD